MSITRFRSSTCTASYGKYNWTQTTLHHHMLNESPKLLFLHWSVTGDADELIKQAKEIIMQTATYQNLTHNTRTPTSGGP